MTVHDKPTWWKVAFYAVLSILVGLPLFYGLGSVPYQQWDEGRILINTLEMVNSGDYLGLTFYGYPEFWNTKPALLHWLQTGFVNILGFSEWSVRLPSAIAAFFTAAVVFLGMQRLYKSELTAVFAVIMLVSMLGFVGFHASRTADYDALLTLFTTLSAVTFYLSVEKNTKWLLAFALFLTLAGLTKGVAALLFLPAYGLFALYRKKVWVLLKSPYFYFGLVFFAAIVGGYYLLRENHQPGYLDAVYKNELGGRFGETIEQHQGPIYFYIWYLIRSVPLPWVLTMVLGVVFGLRSKNENERTWVMFCTLIFVLFTLVLGLAGTKLDWYYVPAYPFIACLSAIGLRHLWLIIGNRLKGSQGWATSALAIVLALALFIPYINRAKSIITFDVIGYHHEKYGSSHYLRKCLEEGKDLPELDVLWDGYDAHVRLYTLLLNERGNNIHMLNTNNLVEGQEVLVSQNRMHEFLRERFEHEEIKIDSQTSIYKLLKDER